MANFVNWDQLADFEKIGIGSPPGPPGGQFMLSVWEEPRAKCNWRGPSGQNCQLGQGAPLVANFGMFTEEHPLVVNLGKDHQRLRSVP